LRHGRSKNTVNHNAILTKRRIVLCMNISGKDSFYN
jgi:hypothetical protein